MKRRWSVTLAVVLSLGALAGLRSACAPAETPAPGVPQPPGEVTSAEAIAAATITTTALAEAVRDRRVLLVGETHFKREPPRFLGQLLDALDDRPIVLLLELPEAMNAGIGRFVASGRSEDLAALYAEDDGLPLHDILRWAHANRSRVTDVRAFDENFPRIAFNRMLLRDTRNATMAAAIANAYHAYPEARIVAYGGSLHMMMAGRYRYDVPNREPAGARLARAGIGRHEVASVWLGGTGTFPLDAVWPAPGVLPIDGPFAALHFAYFIDYPIFGVQRAGELLDFFVHLGPLTPFAESSDASSPG